MSRGLTAPAAAIAPGDPALETALRKAVEGEVLFGRADRGRYATDASIYQVEPLGVVVPRTRDDLAATLAVAREHGVPVLGRGGGTSQCGQTVNRAIVLDCTKHLRKVLEVDVAAQTALVEPGLVLGHLNAALKPHKLFFPVDPSTHQRCTIGGMAGNNSCGGKSIRYGLMADNVVAIDALLADGSRHRFGPTSATREPAGLLAALRTLGEREAAEIAARFPRQLRRVGGYNIDCLTPQARDAGRDNLSRLLVGSEGTLALSEALLLKLVSVKPRKVVGICQFPTFRAAMEATQHLVTLDPEAVELVDRTMIDLGRGIPIYRATIDGMLIGEPEALLMVEFHGDDDAWLASRLAALDELMGDIGHPHAVVHVTNPKQQAEIAEVREAGLNIMMSEKSAGKPISFIEDCAVDLPDLADYTERLNAVFARHGSRPTYYAHASVGCLHVRPVLNMKDDADVRAMRAIAEECFDLVREYKGSHSGEHGDGIARSEFNEPMFGSRLARAFEQVKDLFDPTGLLNPGRVVRPPRFDDRSLFRYSPTYAAAPVTPRMDWSAWPGPQGGLLAAVEMCNNNGTCRKFDAGSMCPSYRITRDEAHLTRGRANTLRLALTGQLGPDALAGDDVAAALKLCVSCKACRRECPVGVDMAKMKIEAGAARAAKHGVALRERLVAELPRYAPWASRLAPLANLRNRVPLLRRLGERFVGISAERPLPAFRRDPFRDAEIGTPAGAANEVILFGDTFNRYYEPENLRAAVRVLRRLGLTPVTPKVAGRPLCCGRTYLSAGLVDRAREEARRTLDALAGDAPVLGLEPSCLMTLRDEFGSLLPGAAADRMKDRARLLTEYMTEHGIETPMALPGVTLHVHGHCHQKSFGAFPAALAALRKIEGVTVKPIESSCCGMAGAFGYAAETLDASRQMAELSLLPAVRVAGPADIVVADGTSCRHQIADLGGREAVHSVRVLDKAQKG